jgi:hypothetical protein
MQNLSTLQLGVILEASNLFSLDVGGLSALLCTCTPRAFSRQTLPCQCKALKSILPVWKSNRQLLCKDLSTISWRISRGFQPTTVSRSTVIQAAGGPMEFATFADLHQLKWHKLGLLTKRKFPSGHGTKSVFIATFKRIACNLCCQTKFHHVEKT